MSQTTEAFSRVKIDALLTDAGWNLTDGVSVLFEHALPDGSRADYVLCDRSGRPAAAFVKCLFEAGSVTRVLFLVDRIALAGQAEDAFGDHLRDYPCHVLRPGRGFDRTKRITIATLQTMITEYRGLSSGYFDLVITDECHRSIYGKWSGVLRHFDAVQLGLTATPCTAEADTLPDPEDGQFVRDTLRFFELKEPTFRYTLREAIDEGHLVPYRIYKAMTVKTAAEDGFEVAREELDWTALDPAARTELEKLFEKSDSISVDPRALERKFTIPERNRAVVREFRDAHENGFMGKDGVRRWRRTCAAPSTASATTCSPGATRTRPRTPSSSVS